jgi:Asp-tRNA(Asn)/Glu-tRNA(Gln) amidotransferase A subunit family amidase
MTRLATAVLAAVAISASINLASGFSRAPLNVASGFSRTVAAPPFDVVEKSIAELQHAMAAGEVSSHDLVAAYLARIDAYDKRGPKLNAMIVLNPRALAEADTLDKERAAKGPRGPLHGIPIVVKDNFETADMPTTGGSIALAGFEPKEDAFQVAKLRAAGAVILGKTNLHELAAGITSISSMGGQTRNPYDLARNPGGSSGGTAAAVAANFAAAGMGSDTCGSIRIPSGHNNLIGLRGTLGLSSRAGIIPLSHTQDIGGPLARSVVDLATMLDVTVGADERDPSTRASAGHIPRSFREGLQGDALKGLRVGALKNLFGAAPEDAEVGAIDRKALDAMKAAGAEVEDVTIPGLDEVLRGSSVINSEFKFDLMDYLARFPDAPVHSLGEIIDTGSYDKALENTFKLRNRPETRETEDYRRARVKRGAARDLVLATMDELKLDVLAYPPISRKAAIIGEPQTGSTNCQLSAASGLPAISMPAGFSDDGVPVGIELLGPAWSESKLLSIAYSYERAAHPRRPPPTTPALTNGAPPPAQVFTASSGPLRAAFAFDVTTGRLSYTLTIAGEPPIAAALHRALEKDIGPVLVRLVDGMGRLTSGEIVLNTPERQALQNGQLYVEITSKGGRHARAPLISRRSPL